MRIVIAKYICLCSPQKSILQDITHYSAIYFTSTDSIGSLSATTTYLPSASSASAAASASGPVSFFGVYEGCDVRSYTFADCDYSIYRLRGAATVFPVTYSVTAGGHLNYAQVPLDVGLFSDDYTEVVSEFATCRPDPNSKHTTTTGLSGSTGKSTVAPKHNQAGLSAGEKTGIGVGVGVGCVALLALAVLGAFLWRRHRRREEASDSRGTEENSVSPDVFEHSEATREMPTGREAHEMPPHSRRVELEGSYGRPRGIESRHELPID
jgi:hypothetical protein